MSVHKDFTECPNCVQMFNILVFTIYYGRWYICHTVKQESEAAIMVLW